MARYERRSRGAPPVIRIFCQRPLVLVLLSAASPALAPYVEARRNERSARIVQAVLTAADGLGTSPLAVALAWVRDRPGVAATLVGARDAAQLAASLAAEPVTLPAEIRAALDDVSAEVDATPPLG